MISMRTAATEWIQSQQEKQQIFLTNGKRAWDVERNILTSLVSRKDLEPQQICTRRYTKGYGRKAWGNERLGKEMIHFSEILASGSSLLWFQFFFSSSDFICGSKAHQWWYAQRLSVGTWRVFWTRNHQAAPKVIYCYFTVRYSHSISSIKPYQSQHSNIREDLVP